MKRTIAIVAGGDTSEYEVSLRSAQGIYSFIDKEKYTLYIVGMRGLDWHVRLSEGKTLPIDRNDFSFTKENGEKVTFDFAYITIHTVRPVRTDAYRATSTCFTSLIRVAACWRRPLPTTSSPATSI